MFVYVCYVSYAECYEGYSEPLAVFSNEQSAKDFCNKPTLYPYEYSKMEVGKSII